MRLTVKNYGSPLCYVSDNGQRNFFRAEKPTKGRSKLTVNGGRGIIHTAIENSKLEPLAPNTEPLRPAWRQPMGKGGEDDEYLALISVSPAAGLAVPASPLSQSLALLPNRRR